MEREYKKQYCLLIPRFLQYPTTCHVLIVAYKAPSFTITSMNKQLSSFLVDELPIKNTWFSKYKNQHLYIPLRGVIEIDYTILKNAFDKPFFLISIPLILSAFMHLWNPIGFPFPDVDEGIYSGRAINFLDTFNPQDQYSGYDHPYFGQILLAALFVITGYQNLFNSPEFLNYEMILFVPRIFMGILAVVDTLLIFKICEVRYNRYVGFIASILFAVMPLTSYTRWIHLDSIQLPLTLLSIFIALISFKGNPKNTNNYHKSIFLVVLSGSFLGLSIFTKIPSFTLIPLIGFLIFTQSKRNLAVLGLWFIPVLLIPAIWPVHSISTGEFNEWVDGINSQAHREPRPLNAAITQLLIDDPFLYILGFAGLIFAAVKKDSFMLLAIIPFLLFMFFINRVVPFHLVFLITFLCISASKLFVDVLFYIKQIIKNKVLKSLSLVFVSSILVLGLGSGLASTITMVTHNVNYQYFAAASFVDNYLKDAKSSNDSSKDDVNMNITVISQPFFSWMQKYKFHNDNFIPYLMIPDELTFETEKVVSIVDSQFRVELQAEENIGTLLKRLFSIFNTNTITNFTSLFPNDKIDILLTNLERPNVTGSKTTDLLDNSYIWKSRHANIQRDVETMNLTTGNDNSDIKSNTALLMAPLNLTGKPAFLAVHYFTNYDGAYDNFILEIRDNKSNLLWDTHLKNTDNITKRSLHVLPEEVSGKLVNMGIRTDAKEKEVSTLTLKKLVLYS